MIKIGLLSDTHNFLDESIYGYFEGCDEIWHAGDFGSIAIAHSLRTVAPVIGVYGNIDGKDVRDEFPEKVRCTREGVDIWMTHIGGNPGRYALPIREEMDANPPDLFICGHSHILKIVRDKNHKNTIHMNPGAAGRQGFHYERTIVRFTLDNGKLKDAEVIELGPRTEQQEQF